MHVPRIPAVAFGLVLLAAGLAFPSRRHTPPAIAQALSGPAPLSLSDVKPADVVPGRVDVTFARGTDPGRAERLIAAAGASVRVKLPEIELYGAALPPGMSVGDGIAALSKLPDVVAAEPVTREKAALVPNDPLYPNYQQSYLELIHAQEAWDIQLGDPSVVVAVIDTGVDITHPDLADNIWTNPNAGQDGCGNDVHGCNFVDPADFEGTCPGDAPPNPNVTPSFFHGTYVAGIVAASTNNGIGIAGVAPHVKIMPVKVLGCGGEGTTTSIIQGMLYAINNGARVVNLSLGGTSSCTVVASGMFSAVYQAQQKGIVVVAASGNENQGCAAAPANIPGVMAVGATGPTGDARASFSNYGREISVAAPGVGILSTSWGPTPRGVRPGDGNLLPPYGAYAKYSGTSAASPLVAGLAALLFSQNRLLTGDMVRGLIERGATPLPLSDVGEWAGAGRIDLAGSLRRVPGAYQGHVFLDQSVPDGTAVDAKVGSQVCGHTVTSTVQGQSAYALFVAPAADVPGCGTPGGQLTFSVGGQDVATVPFSQTAVQLDLGRATAAAPTNSSGAVLYHSGWNIVAGPAGTSFIAATGALFTLQPNDPGYETIATADGVKTGYGYWAYFPRDVTIPLGADGPQTYSMTLPPGQPVLLGNPSGSRSVTVSGADSVLIYDPVAASYKDARTLQPGQGAWVTSNAGGTVTLQ